MSLEAIPWIIENQDRKAVVIKEYDADYETDDEVSSYEEKEHCYMDDFICLGVSWGLEFKFIEENGTKYANLEVMTNLVYTDESWFFDCEIFAKLDNVDLVSQMSFKFDQQNYCVIIEKFCEVEDLLINEEGNYGGRVIFHVIAKKSHGIPIRRYIDVYQHHPLICDAQIMVRGREFHVSKAILAMNSPVFYEKLKNSLKFELFDVDPIEFRRAIHILYYKLSPKSWISPDFVEDSQFIPLLEFAEKYKIIALKVYCERAILKMKINTSERVDLARRFGLLKLLKAAGASPNLDKNEQKTDEKPMKIEEIDDPIPFNFWKNMSVSADHGESDGIKNFNFSFAGFIWRAQYIEKRDENNAKFIEWTMAVSPTNEDDTNFELDCRVHFERVGYPEGSLFADFKFDSDHRSFVVKKDYNWCGLNWRDDIILQLAIRENGGVNWNIDYNKENSMISDAVLVANGKVFHVSKAILCINSTVFTQLFQQSSRVELENVEPSELIELLKIVYNLGSNASLDYPEEKLEKLLKMFDTYELSNAKLELETMIMKNMEYQAKKKVEIADGYGLNGLLLATLKSCEKEELLEMMQPRFMERMKEETKEEIKKFNNWMEHKEYDKSDEEY